LRNRGEPRVEQRGNQHSRSRRAIGLDLLFFSGLGYVGIYLGHGAVIHAPHPGARVRFEWLRGWLASSFYRVRRLRLVR
jgi:cell wall-associated NlpC family hydrolase